ncbi:HD domain-containing protein [Thorsellia kenyensis]|uniref:5'-deoxynucleotidase n=1 Tax=Thorsellia kenyensis TaxID=1549888 RepID=A0ABV6C9M1_9GAMM
MNHTHNETLDFGQFTATIQFWMEIDKLKQIERKTKIYGQHRHENSAEHSWQLAIGLLTLKPFLPAHLDFFRMVKMALLHDIVEIDAGDVIAFDLAAREANAENEKKAAHRIFGILSTPLKEEFMSLWEEYEDSLTPESKYAQVIDRIMPMMLNLHNGGQSWVDNGIAYEQVIQRASIAKEMIPELYEVIVKQLQDAKNKGWLK